MDTIGFITGDFLQDLAHTVMEAEKSPDLPDASRTTRKARGVCQPEPEGTVVRVPM